MKAKPSERAALDLARTLTALDLETASALSKAPDLYTFARRHDRVRLAQTRLVWAAENWNRRALIDARRALLDAEDAAARLL